MTRIVFIGDELVAGYGDTRALGWTGRVLSRTVCEPPVLPITLAVPGEAISDLAERWEDEVTRRLDHDEGSRLVIGLGTHGLETSSMARSRLHLANIVDSAERLRLKPFVVGPPPRRDISPRLQSELTHAYAEVCTRRGVPFVDTFTPLVAHEQWNTDMAMTAGYAPAQAGYGLLAWLVLHNGWNSWLGIPAASSE